MTTKYEYDRIPYLLAFAEQSKFKDTYGGSADLVALESYWLKPKDKPSDTVILFMHPIGGGAYLPMVSALAKKGCHVIYCNSRYRGTDSALIMEKVVLDMAACVLWITSILNLSPDLVTRIGWWRACGAPMALLI